MKNFVKATLITTCVLLAAISSSAQQMPVFGSTPDPGADRVEVRFAIGTHPVTCRRFFLEVRREGKVLVEGDFSSGFKLSADGSKTSSSGQLDVRIGCGKYRWHFSEVPSRALSQGWWWVGTDHPPFQSEFEGPKFARCHDIRYMIVHPTNQEGFDYFQTTPNTLQDSPIACTGR